MIKVCWDFSGGVNSEIFNDLFARFSSYPNSSILINSGIGEFDITHYHRLHKNESISNGVNIATIHYDISDEEMFPLSDEYIYKLNKVDRLVCISHQQADFIKRKVGIKTPIDVIHHGYDKRLIRTSINRGNYKELKRKNIISLISKRYNNKQKGENFLFEILRNIPSEEYSLLLIGDGRDKDLLKFRSLGFDVYFCNPSCYEDLLSLYKLIDIVLVLSRSEGGPACIPEALAAGCSVISKRVGMAADVLNNNIVIADNVDEFVDAIKNNTTLPSISLNDIFSWEEVIEKHLSLYLMAYI